jgi:demethylmacrocin O-methyltransferase
MSLASLVDNSLTDKNTRHSYLGLYEKLLCKKKETATFVLEVGVGDFEDKNGGSIKMWRDYFPNATIVGLDILPINRVIDELLNDDRVVLYMETNAYNKDFFENTFLNKNIKYDFLLDDGPHSL